MNEDNAPSTIVNVSASIRTVIEPKSGVSPLTVPPAVLSDEGARQCHPAARLMGVPTFRQRVLGHIPSGRLGTVEEVASAVVFLASPAASLVTGSSLLTDGGWAAWYSPMRGAIQVPLRAGGVLRHLHIRFRLRAGIGHFLKCARSRALRCRSREEVSGGTSD
ncbi:MAG: SDR family oxidoreductase [Stellaceae bacterium]